MCCVAVYCVGLMAPRTTMAQPATVPRYQPAADEFSALSNSVAALLRTRDAARFARELAPSPEDWKSVVSTNAPEGAEEALKGMTESAGRMEQQVREGAKALLAKADELHLDFSRGELHLRVVTPKSIGNTRFTSLQAEEEAMPFAQNVEIVLNPDRGTNKVSNGEFKLGMRSLLKFPGGWRSYEGIRWEAFPADVVDENTQREMAILEKAASYQGITDGDDPALMKLGAVLVRLIKERDVDVYVKGALMNSDRAWAELQKSGQTGVSRAELDTEINLRVKEQTELARAMLKLMDDAGVDLKDAEIHITGASLKQIQAHGAAGSLEGLMGDQFRLNLAVKSNGKSRSGASPSGDYVIGAGRITRYGDDWKIGENLHWQQFPTGVLDDKAEAALEFENYVAENRTLPPGTAAPEIQFSTLDGKQSLKLSDLRGKVVVLDFWATWCGPCRQPMVDLQKLPAAHPDWKDKVALVPLSIDDTPDIVIKHVEKRGWTNTFNVWAGDGGWHSASARAFRVGGVPTTYIIDAQGKIVVAGHPAGIPIADQVDYLLKKQAD